MQSDTVQSAQPIELARQVVYQFLSLAFSDPLSRRWQRLRDPEFLGAAVDAAAVLREAAGLDACERAPGELPSGRLDPDRAVQLLGDPSFDVEAEFKRTFGLMMSKKHPPYESEYCPQTFSVYRAQVIADVAGFYRAFGLEPSRDTPERHDHVALELEFMAWLIMKERHARHAHPEPKALENAQVCAEAARRFFRQHVAWWMPAFAHALRRHQGTAQFYRSLADVLAAFIHAERALTDTAAPTELVAPKRTEDADAECEQCCSIANGQTGWESAENDHGGLDDAQRTRS
jgi:DMSO reductase family type II enzyme chaperone